MAKIVGFNQDVAAAAVDAKRADQRKQSNKRASKHIHMNRVDAPMSHPVLNLQGVRTGRITYSKEA